MTTKRTITVVLDRFEGGQAVMLSDSGESFTLDKAELDQPVSEGAVLRVPLSESGSPIWAEARLDSKETENRLKEARRLLGRLRTGRHP